VLNLIEHMNEFRNNLQHYNIEILKVTSANNSLRALSEVSQ